MAATIRAKSPRAVDAFLSRVRGELGDAAVSQRALHTALYARDLWPRGTIAVREGVIENRPSAVVWPRDEAAISRILAVASETATPIVPYGAGSGVCGGTVALGGAVIVDLKRLDRVVSVDREAWTARAEAGVMGQLLEDELNRNSMTLGHFPSSIYCSSLGGWIATRSGGQLSSKYGKIEDQVLGLRIATPRGIFAVGDIDDAGATRLDVGFMQAFMGSEGLLGVITDATLRLHPVPTARAFRAFAFPSVAAGCDAMRAIMQAGIEPAVLRLYDEFDTWINKPPKSLDVAHPERWRRVANEREARGVTSGLLALKKRLTRELGGAALRAGLRAPAFLNRLAGFAPGNCLLITMYEDASADSPARDEAAAHDIVQKLGARDLGPGPAETWFARRYHISYKLPTFFEMGLFVDTLEFAAPWSRFVGLVEAVRCALGETVFVMAHMSHAYVDGCSVYFTFAGRSGDLDETRCAYDRTIAAALNAAARSGGSVTHHHGVGLSKAPFAKREVGPAMAIFRALKASLDPAGVLNPGKAGL
jgi:alkyldihydroxyacetonephosphate synthase